MLDDLSESDTGVKYKQKQSFTQPATLQKTQWGTTKAKRRSQHNLYTASFPATPPEKKKTWQCNILRHKWWTEDYDPECPPGLLDARAFSRGWRAFTTMLMFGRKSASYCTHNAATAANYLKDTRKQISISSSMTSVSRQKLNEENQAPCHCFDIISKHC